jgi:hypothetical protein
MGTLLTHMRRVQVLELRDGLHCQGFMVRQPHALGAQETNHLNAIEIYKFSILLRPHKQLLHCGIGPH